MPRNEPFYHIYASAQRHHGVDTRVHHPRTKEEVCRKNRLSSSPLMSYHTSQPIHCASCETLLPLLPLTEASGESHKVHQIVIDTKWSIWHMASQTSRKNNAEQHCLHWPLCFVARQSKDVCVGLRSSHSWLLCFSHPIKAIAMCSNRYAKHYCKEHRQLVGARDWSAYLGYVLLSCRLHLLGYENQ